MSLALQQGRGRCTAGLARPNAFVSLPVYPSMSSQATPLARTLFFSLVHGVLPVPPPRPCSQDEQVMPPPADLLQRPWCTIHPGMIPLDFLERRSRLSQPSGCGARSVRGAMRTP